MHLFQTDVIFITIEFMFEQTELKTFGLWEMRTGNLVTNKN